jgi:hypothetical protein
MIESFDPLKDHSPKLHDVVAIYSAWMNHPYTDNKNAYDRVGSTSVHLGRFYADSGGLDPSTTEITMYWPLRMIPICTV